MSPICDGWGGNLVFGVFLGPAGSRISCKLKERIISPFLQIMIKYSAEPAASGFAVDSFSNLKPVASVPAVRVPWQMEPLTRAADTTQQLFNGAMCEKLHTLHSPLQDHSIIGFTICALYTVSPDTYVQKEGACAGLLATSRPLLCSLVPVSCVHGNQRNECSTYRAACKELQMPLRFVLWLKIWVSTSAFGLNTNRILQNCGNSIPISLTIVMPHANHKQTSFHLHHLSLLPQKIIYKAGDPS